MADRIYLDNAATSWPKPASVYEIVDHYQRHLGAPAGRASYREAGEVERLVAESRRAVARLIGAESASQIVFTANGTDSLNLAIHGLVRPGDHVVTTVVEHNSVLRPLRWLEEHGSIEVTRLPCDEWGLVDPAAFEPVIRPKTRLIVLNHVSNVTGAIQPVREVGRIAREHGVRFLVDAAQSLGHLPCSVVDLGASLLAAPGHKGLLGPLGVGMLFIAPDLVDELESIRQGGTGTHSDADVQPAGLPDKYESGNHNVPAILGLGKGVEFVLQRTPEALRSHEQMLTAQLIEGVRRRTAAIVHGPGDAERQGGVVSISVPGLDPRELAAILDSTFGVQVRSGIHCAPLMHRALGTDSQGGTVRFSFGPFNTAGQIDAVVAALADIVGSNGV